MKNHLLVIILGIVALGGGFGLILAADHYGWIGNAAAIDGVCPHEIDAAQCPFCSPSLVDSLGSTG